MVSADARHPRRTSSFLRFAWQKIYNRRQIHCQVYRRPSPFQSLHSREWILSRWGGNRSAVSIGGAYLLVICARIMAFGNYSHLANLVHSGISDEAGVGVDEKENEAIRGGVGGSGGGWGGRGRRGGGGGVHELTECALETRQTLDTSHRLPPLHPLILHLWVYRDAIPTLHKTCQCC